jgi:hypothetical protein
MGPGVRDVRYRHVPGAATAVTNPDGCSALTSPPRSTLTTATLAILSRYLSHERPTTGRSGSSPTFGPSQPRPATFPFLFQI